MPRSRGTEMPQRPSPRGPPSLRTSSSDSDHAHHRSRTDRSPKISDGRSPRTAQSDPVNQKKLGTRISDLESQLGQAQEELKSLKDQLASAEAAKKAAQEQLEKKSKKQQKETDVFEVTIEKVTVEPKTELEPPANQDELKPKPVSLPNESLATSQPEDTSFDELALKNDEINSLKTKLDEKDKELGLFHQENENLKTQLNEKSLKISSAVSEMEDLKLRLNNVEEELEKSKNGAAQTEQWRKAADAAASILAGEVEMNGRRISERCGSMDKHYGNSFEPIGGYAGYVGFSRAD
ncbi:Interactor of constitutive active ROPs 4 [Sesamum angolense]|uniref:Interactor of constitutive active ROPs 4 n=1 Tax=Sesamum angolense TaxID=2727404 RepID=A0AAE2BJ03_9LAMI|nr:Interactor of constitutive active ROPs 4 [Sesamum angolense]